MIFVPFLDAAGNQLTSTNNSGKQSLDVNITGGSASGAQTDSSTFTAASSSDTPVGGVFNDTPIAALTSGQQGAVRLTNNRAFHVNLRAQGGTEYGASQAGGFNVIIGDGTNVPAVKAASTAPAAADKALVAAISPNSTFLGSASGGTAGSQSSLGGGVFNTSAPTLTNGQQAALQLDVNGNQKVAVQGTVAVSNSQDFSATATPTAVALTAATAATLVTASANNKYISIYNNGVTPIKIALGATATTSVYTTVIQAGGTYERKGWQGSISGFSTLANSALVTVET